MIAPEVSVQDSPPQALSVEPDGIPEELKRRSQWVNWKYAWDGKKWTKHPYNPRTRRKASSTDLLTWSMFVKTLKAYEEDLYDGIGFMFCSGDPYVGVDLDNCVDPETGEIKPWATQVVEGLNSYTELSPSGKGLHIIVRGKVPSPVKKKHIEIYSIERYFTITGHEVAA